MKVKALQGDTVDLLCQRHYGITQGVTGRPSSRAQAARMAQKQANNSSSPSRLSANTSPTASSSSRTRKWATPVKKSATQHVPSVHGDQASTSGPIIRWRQTRQALSAPPH